MTAQDSRRNATDKASTKPNSSDGYYGHEQTAKMAAAFITSLFACPELPPPSTNLTPSGQPAPQPKLPIFIAYALHRTRLASCVTFAALFLLQRLKNRFPAARGSSGHRLFISAFMIASKVVCDDTYSNKSWAVVGQAMFGLREINQMEREMCGYLEWHLNVDHLELQDFSEKVQSEFGNGGVPSVTPVASSVAPALPKTTLTAPSTSKYESSSTAAPLHNIPSPATIMTSAEDDEEDVESASNSLTSSPASSAALNTPPSAAEIDGAAIVGSGGHHHHGIAAMMSQQVPKMMAAGGVVPGSSTSSSSSDSEAAKITLDRHGRPAYAAAAQW